MLSEGFILSLVKNNAYIVVQITEERDIGPWLGSGLTSIFRLGFHSLDTPVVLVFVEQGVPVEELSTGERQAFDVGNQRTYARVVPAHVAVWHAPCARLSVSSEALRLHDTHRHR